MPPLRDFLLTGQKTCFRLSIASIRIRGPPPRLVEARAEYGSGR